MKKLSIILSVLALGAVASAAVFIATFDADSFRPLIVQRMEALLGSPVSLERVSLRWRNGAALSLQGLRIRERAHDSEEPLAQAQEISAQVRLVPLLGRRVEIVSVVLDSPRIRLVKDARHTVHAGGLTLAAAPAASVQSQASATDQRAQGLSVAVERIQIRNGELVWEDQSARSAVRLQFKRIDATITDIAPGRPIPIKAQAAFGQDVPNLRISARVWLPDSGRPVRLDDLVVEITDLRLERVLPAAGPQDPGLSGQLSASFKGQARGLTPEHLAESLSGNARINLKQGVLINVNILRTALSQLSMIPGVVEKLSARLPPEYLAQLKAKDTPLSPLDASMAFEQGQARFSDLTVGTDALELEGSGRFGLDGDFQASGMLRIAPALSRAVIEGVNELEALADSQGRITFPVAARASASSAIAIAPDLQYIGRKVVATQATELLTDLLKKALDSREPQPAASAQP
jgi:uncharacterized protein involved in outer membrane biogenesis